MLASIGDKKCVILRNHGLLSWGHDIPEAFMWLWTLQRACDVQIAASSAGALHPVSTAGARAMRARGRPAGAGRVRGGVCRTACASSTRRARATPIDDSVDGAASACGLGDGLAV